MNAIYFSMKGTSQKVTLSLELDMENKGCLLFDISGMVKPYIEPPNIPMCQFCGQQHHSWLGAPNREKHAITHPTSNKFEEDQ